MKGRQRWSDVRARAEPETLEEAARKSAEMLSDLKITAPFLDGPARINQREEVGGPSEPGSAEL